jgi:hypothetical protein
MNAENHIFHPDSHKQPATENLPPLFGGLITLFPDNMPNLSEYLKRNKMQMVNVDILADSGKILLVSTIFEVHNPPIYHYDIKGERTSDAQYYIDEHRMPNGDIIYLSKLGPNSKTSSHRHPSPVNEFYIVFYGTGYQNRRRMERRSVVLPGDLHQVRTGREPALFGIKMEGTADIPSHMLHLP